VSTDRPSIAPLGPVTGAAATKAPARAGSAAAAGFDQILTSKLQSNEASGALRWSAHAVQRLSQRQIPITPEVQQRLEGAVDKLAAKGGRESIVLVDRMAFVVSVTNRTVITAVDQAGMRDQVFTNIDSAVLS
jgi:flagellar operon protein